ncbi:uncharacterized protein Dwil_GK22939 [Drosophila willistoni]|uniref:Uncharacterized protein n=1 Tax=Drosophila willistoni TaxID=7260 RepID=B4NN82_DROWI|nr:uncharacterized protein LOC6652202 [Drosophila willistoni]EDW85821.1 uncharacterized protein Dwil_GK22939 [Drosophila willistoni]
MRISCKCLNITATLPKLQRSNSINICGGGLDGGANGGDLVTNLHKEFRRFCQSTEFQNHTQFADFFNNVHGPIPELTINAIKLPELLVGLTLDIEVVATGVQSWQFVSCIICKEVVCAKRLPAGADGGVQFNNSYLINRTLLTSNEELAQRRGSKLFSECFGVLILEGQGSSGIAPSASNQSIGSLSSIFMDERSLRLRQLTTNQQARVQAEIAKTNERIERFTQKEFELLNSYREKSNQDYAHLTRLIVDCAMNASLEVPDNWLATATGGTALGGAGGGGAAARGGRRNTIGSRRDLNVPITPTTPTTAVTQPPNFPTLSQHQQQLQPLISGGSSVLSARKMSNFDTPPATPEATPMSVGNSPTFRQQAGGIPARNPSVTNTSTLAMGGVEEADDCLFDLEDVEETTTTPSHPVQTSSFTRAHIYQQQQQSYQRLQSQQLDNSMDNVDEGVAADEAEYAVDLDSSLPIPMRGARSIPAHIMNFAKSLPIEISNSPLAERANNNFIVEDEEVLDNIDIAASIQALAKSVHGEAVFGDLPRPRLSSQI